MEARLIEWADINSGSGNAAGLSRMADLLAAAFRALGAATELVPLSEQAKVPAHIVRARVRPEAPIQVMLVGHFDTVYGPDSPFQQCTRVDADAIRGPGVADMKGGLVVMLEALRAFEAGVNSENVGWEAFIVPDEETGSEGSGRLLQAAAEKHRLGIVFEPAMPDGSIVGSRKGVGVLRVTARGRAAHAGRDFANGRSAIVALARFVGAAHMLNTALPDVVVNAGSISGGGVINVVPDQACAAFNIRAVRETDGDELLRRMYDSATAISRALEVTLELEGGFDRPPMETTPKSKALIDAWCATARDLGVELHAAHSGGGSDGNLLVAAGLPTLDGVGVEGGGLHSDGEWIRPSSLPRRARIAAVFLHRIASGKIAVPGRTGSSS
jgi:glutamate carboxypeptidase